MGNRPDETQSIEYEAKVLNVDPDNIDRRVLSQGGVKVADRLMRRYVYDIEPGDMSRWIRLRDTGTSVTLATKRIRHDGIDGTDEVEVGVDSFEKTHALLGAMGFVAKAYQENRRVSYRLNDCDVELDSWPLIPVYVEIEGRSRDHVIEVARLLGFTETDLTGENTTKIYSRYGIDLSSISDLRL
ncbi:CYTH domain-containing protein [Pseudonocardia sp.]|jgi:adenylate cyclase class 2|uniref:class IV adenylate cyclase n=1 Tax=Pseudonocardia sp. TaxID=60912 RepID=UPI0031FDA521